MEEHKYLIYGIAALAAALIVVGAIITFISAPASPDAVDTAPTTSEGSSETPALAPNANPLKEVTPTENPIEKTNPFKNDYQNPFE